MTFGTGRFPNLKGHTVQVKCMTYMYLQMYLQFHNNMTKIVLCFFSSSLYYAHTHTHTPAAALPSPILASVCPRISDDTGGVCVQACTNDDSCQGDQLCCSNGCGRSCVDPDRVPYYDIPWQCPTSDLTTGTCVLTNASCLTNDQCDTDGELCCQSGCGRRLVKHFNADLLWNKTLLGLELP